MKKNAKPTRAQAKIRAAHRTRTIRPPVVNLRSSYTEVLQLRAMVNRMVTRLPLQG